jgi:hypothetical protein
MRDLDPRFTSPEERRDYWPIARILLLAALLLLGGRWLLHNYPVPFLDQGAWIERRQRENDRLLSHYVDTLAERHDEEGTFPLGLVDLLRPTRVPGGIARGIPPRDAWGHRLRFFSDGSMFLLVSLGRDGVAETEDYHELRSGGLREAVCDDPDADLVVSDRGWHRRCDPDAPAGEGSVQKGVGE